MMKAIKARRQGLAQKKVSDVDPSRKTQNLIEQVSSMGEEEKKQLLRMLGVTDQKQSQQREDQSENYGDENIDRDKAKKTDQFKKNEKVKKEKEMINTRIRELEDELAFGEEEESTEEDDQMIDDDRTVKIAEGMIDRKYLRNPDLKPKTLQDRVGINMAQIINQKRGKA